MDILYLGFFSPLPLIIEPIFLHLTILLYFGFKILKIYWSFRYIPFWKIVHKPLTWGQNGHMGGRLWTHKKTVITKLKSLATLLVNINRSNIHIAKHFEYIYNAILQLLVWIKYSGCEYSTLKSLTLTTKIKNAVNIIFSIILMRFSVVVLLKA